MLHPPPGAPTPRMMGRERMVMEPGLTAPCSTFWVQQRGHQSADGVAPVGTRCPSAFPAKPSLFCEGSCVFRVTACSQELGTAAL